jgi:serine/threonine protein phosphatase PrpC
LGRIGPANELAAAGPAIPLSGIGGHAQHPANANMSSVDSLPLTLPLPLPPADTGRRTRRRILGAILAEAETADVASFDFAGGTAAVFTTRSPGKLTPNEDVAALLPTSTAAGVLAVADGLGGHVGGERASRLAVETIQGQLLEAAASPAETEADGLRGTILDGIEAANRAVRELGTGAATTLALIEVQGRTIRSYHVGDSVILLTGQRGKLKLQTIAHSPIGYAVEAGLMNEEDAIHHADRHVISNVIGSEQMRIEIGPSIEMAQRDTLVLASDGLVDNLLPSEVVEFVRSGPLDEAVGAMVAEARRRMTAADGQGPSKPDDLTVIAYRPS